MADQALKQWHHRPPAFQQKVRERIETSKIVRRLQQHVDGEIEMSATQVAAAKLLLDRTVPPLKPVEIQDDSGIQDVSAVPIRRLLESIDGQSRRLAVDQRDAEE